jgi:hypothetical protein
LPTLTEREYYALGFSDGYKAGKGKAEVERLGRKMGIGSIRSSKPKRKLSAWNKFVKANSKKKIYRYANGKLKLKKMGIAFRKKKRR